MKFTSTNKGCHPKWCYYQNKGKSLPAPVLHLHEHKNLPEKISDTEVEEVESYLVRVHQLANNGLMVPNLTQESSFLGTLFMPNSTLG